MRSLNGARFMESACSSDTISAYSITECLWAGRSDVCEIVIAESPVYGKILFLDKELQSAESDEVIYHEHLIHPVMNAMHGVKEKKVLIVGGGEAATAREVLRWPASAVGHVDWVDIDGDLVNLCRRHLSWADDAVYNDPRLHFYPADIRQFLAEHDTQYDVIVLDLPDPDSDMEADEHAESPTSYPLYGSEFWRVLRAHCAPDGAVVSHVGPVMPAGDESVRRAGLALIKSMATAHGFGAGHAYHATIPSFQNEWGFWMSVAPSDENNYPDGLIVMDDETQKYAFTWPRYWTSPWF